MDWLTKWQTYLSIHRLTDTYRNIIQVTIIDTHQETLLHWEYIFLYMIFLYPVLPVTMSCFWNHETLSLDRNFLIESNVGESNVMMYCIQSNPIQSKEMMFCLGFLGSGFILGLPRSIGSRISHVEHPWTS